jgi:hypothetical protein
MIILAALFLFSVWLVRSVPRQESSQPSAPPAHTADYDFQNFTLKSYEMNGKCFYLSLKPVVIEPPAGE